MLILLGARHPSKPKWASDLMVQYVWVIVILGIAAAGLSLFVFALSKDAPPVAILEYLMSLGVALGTVGLIKLLSVKKKADGIRCRPHSSIDRFADWRVSIN
ncbi:MAG TPA: hypothetical protein VLR50_03490 [Desulfobacterales bacterium]|nr:hypothetical protein [Desulfobacterales bacterium]